MDIKRLARRVEAQYGGDLARMLGVQQADVRFRVGSNGTGTSGTNIVLDPSQLQGGRRDTKGAILHELTHAYEQSTGVPTKRVEALADAARARLGFGSGAGYSSAYEDKLTNLSGGAFRRVAQAQAGGNVAEYRGGKVGDGGRKRNTQQNGLSKLQGGAAKPNGKALPALTPEQNANYYQQLQALYAGYQNQLQGFRQQRVGLRTGFQQQRTDIRSQMISDLASTQQAGIASGFLGSSIEAEQEIGVRASAEQQRAAAKTDMLNQLAANRIEEQGAAIDYFAGATSLEATKLAQQQTQLAANLQNNLILSGLEHDTRNDGGNGGGGNGGNGNGGNGGGNVPEHREAAQLQARAPWIIQQYQQIVGPLPNAVARASGTIPPLMLRQMLDQIRRTQQGYNAGVGGHAV